MGWSRVSLGAHGGGMHGVRVGSRARAVRVGGRTGRSSPTTTAKWYQPEDLKVGKLLGEGSFGLVYEGTLRNQRTNEDKLVILKRAKAKVQGSEEMADLERQLNERVRRHAADACAQYVGSCLVEPQHMSSAAPKLVNGLWLIWNWEGTLTLSHHLRSPSFPRDLVPALLGKEAFKGNTQVVRQNSAAVELVVAQTVMRQLLASLNTLHGAGMVHRDIKPQNMVLHERERRFKLIDLGACADLRTGANFSPDETILDPKYAAPEEYVLPQEAAPDLASHPEPVAMILGANAWVQHAPDRFDMFAVGIIMLQLCLSSLRSDVQLQRFNRELRRYNYDVLRWKRSRRFHQRETTLLDADNGAGWELAAQLLSEVPKKRPSASAAKAHRWFRVSLDPSLPASYEPAYDSDENASVTEIASMAMRSALSRLRQLESAVLRVEGTLTKQTQVLGTLRKDQGADPRVVEREERRLEAIKAGLQKRLSAFDALSREVNRLLARSDRQMEYAEIASETQVRKAEAKAYLGATGEDDLPPGWGTRVRRTSSSIAKVGGNVLQAVSSTASQSVWALRGRFTAVGGDVKVENMGVKGENGLPLEIDREPESFLSLLSQMWNKRTPSLGRKDRKKLNTGKEFVGDGSRGVPEEQVDDMRMAMDGLEREVETMAEKMAAMEDRLKEQRRIIAMLEDSDISTGGTLTKSRKTTAARIHRD